MKIGTWSLNDDPDEAARSAALNQVYARFAISYEGVTAGLEIAEKQWLHFIVDRSNAGDAAAQDLHRDHFALALADRGAVLAWLGEVSRERDHREPTPNAARAQKALLGLEQAEHAAQPWPGLPALVREGYAAKVREGGQRLRETASAGEAS